MNRPVMITGNQQISHLRGHFTNSDGLSLSLIDTAGENHYLIPVNQGIGPLLRRHLNDPLPEWASIPYHIGSFLPRRLLPDGKTRSLRNGCWVYFFRNGYLWREIRTPLESAYTQLNDVNLATQFGKDQRLATCPGSSAINIPYRINEQMPEYRLIFSEIQLSWAQLVALGGLHPEDPRNPDGEDQQTAETLQHLEKRSSLLQLTEDLGYIRSTNLEGSGQPDYPLPDVPPKLDYTYLCIADPLQDARDLKATHDEQLGLLAHCMESRQSGPMALAALIENLTANGDPNKLERHLASDRHDRALLQAVRELEDQLPDRILAAEQALVDYLQTHETSLLAVLSDHLQDQPQARQLGLLHLNLLISDWSAPESLDWLYIRLNETAEPTSIWHLAQGEDKNLLEHLRQEVGQEQSSISPDHPLLQGQQNNDPWLLATLASTLLVRLIENHDLALGHKHKQDTATLMENVASRFTKLSGIRINIMENATLGEWLPHGINENYRRGYHFFPKGLADQIKNLGHKGISQLVPEGHVSLRAFLSWLDATPRGNMTSTLLFGPLLLRNAWSATQAATATPTTENRLERYAAVMACLKFITDRLQRIYPELSLNHTQSNHINARSGARASIAGRIKNVGIFAARFVFKLINRLYIVAETTLSAWHFMRGFRTGNTGVMVTSGIMLIVGLLAIPALMAGPVFWILLLIGLGAALLREWFEYSKLETAIRLGWFGRRSYPSGDYVSFSAPSSTWKDQQFSYIHTLQNLANGQPLSTLHLQALEQMPDLTAELQAITQSLFDFSAQVQVLQLSEYHSTRRGRRARSVAGQHQVLIELEVTLTQFTPLDSLLDGYIELGQRRIHLRDTWVHEHPKNTQNPPEKVTFYTLASIHEATFACSARLWLSPDGSSTNEQALSLELNQPRRPRPMYRIFQPEWDRVFEQARYRPDQTARLTPGQSSINEELQATLIHHLFHNTLQGAS